MTGTGFAFRNSSNVKLDYKQLPSVMVLKARRKLNFSFPPELQFVTIKASKEEDLESFSFAPAMFSQQLEALVLQLM